MSTLSAINSEPVGDTFFVHTKRAGSPSCLSAFLKENSGTDNFEIRMRHDVYRIKFAETPSSLDLEDLRRKVIGRLGVF